MGIGGGVDVLEDSNRGVAGRIITRLNQGTPLAGYKPQEISDAQNGFPGKNISEIPQAELKAVMDVKRDLVSGDKGDGLVQELFGGKPVAVGPDLEEVRGKVKAWVEGRKKDREGRKTTQTAMVDLDDSRVEVSDFMQMRKESAEIAAKRAEDFVLKQAENKIYHEAMLIQVKKEQEDKTLGANPDVDRLVNTLRKDLKGASSTGK